MSVEELLQHEIFDLPHGWVGWNFTDNRGMHTCRSYHQFIIRRLAQYQELLADLHDIMVNGSNGLVTRVPYVSNADEVRRAVRLTCIGILNTLKAYASGSPSNAQAELTATLDSGPNQGLLQGPGRYFYLDADAHHTYYRLRPSDKVLTAAHELFHPPFDMRWKTRSYRFSIAGYPSIYAATSPLLALCELRKEQYTPDLYAARLRAIPYESPEMPVRDVRFLDLRNQVQEFRRRYARGGPQSGEIMGFLVRWPLVMATSVPTGYPNPTTDPPNAWPGFNEEYVLPQLLLEWVNNSRGKDFKITGITYSSSRLDAKPLTDAGQFNIVVPAEQPSSEGFCPIRTRQFEISKPVALSELLANTPDNQTTTETTRLLVDALKAQPYQRLPLIPAVDVA